jgi:pyridoxamine 5'-phosphate oxidase
MVGLDALRSRDPTVSDDPFAVFGAWLDDATDSEPNDPTAMAVATIDADGLPDVRMVLLKAWDARGFVFYTNFESAKGRELAGHPKAAALFHWKTQRRQVRIRGPVSVVTDAEADAYFASRPRGSQVGAWASRQSRPIESRAALEAAVAEVEARHPAEVPRPPHWSGFRITPLQIELWSDGAFRLHDRFLFARPTPEGPWTKTRLSP